MPAVVRRFATWLLLASYLFAVTAANSFHDHGVCQQAQGDAGNGPDHGGSNDDCGQAADAVPLDGGLSGTLSRADCLRVHPSDQSCSVCQFLSHKLVPMRPVESIHVEALTESAVAARPLAVPCRPLLVHHSRAPPSAA